MFGRRPSAALAAIALLGLLTRTAALSAESTLTPSIAASGEVTDNVDFEPTGAKSDAFLTLTPSVRYQLATEAAKFGATAGVEVLRHSKERENDDVRQAYTATVTQRSSERTGWDLGARFRQSSALETRLEETGLVERRATRRTLGANAGLAHQLKPRSDLSAAYAYDRNLFDSETSVDYSTHTLALTYGARFESRLSALRLGPSYVRYRSSESAADTVGVALGGTSRPTERLTVNASLGPLYTVTETYGAGGDRETHWGLNADLSLTWLGEASSTTLGFVQSQTHDSEGQLRDTARVFIGLRKAFTEYWEGSLSASYSHTWSPGDSRSMARYIQATPTLSWRVSEHGRLSASYNFGESYDRSREEGKVARRNRAWVTASFDFPGKW